MSDNFQNWVDRVAVDRGSKPLTEGEVVKTPPPQPFGAVEFVKVEKKGFVAEVGKKGDFYVYHFYPSDLKNHGFFDKMEEALLQIFKNPEQIEVDWVEEFKSYAVRVRGWTSNIWGDELAVRAIDVLEEKLNVSSS